jgi:hypothetical protein
LPDTGWYKSTYSDAGNEACVEVRVIANHIVGVRDSKNPRVNALWIQPITWQRFIDTLT